MVFRGVVEASFGNYVCIRGFAPLGDLARHSRIDDSYQRRPTEAHVRDIRDFIKRGEYLYFPEILLGMACDGFRCGEKRRRSRDRPLGLELEHYEDDKSQSVGLYHVLKNMVLPRHEKDPRKCRFYSRHFGSLTVTVGERKNYYDRCERERAAQNEDVPPFLLNVSVSGFERVNGGSPLYCIDGNHRLEAARQDKDLGRSLVPFCLMLFEDADTCREHGAMLFHNINYHSQPVSDERNARTIIGQEKADGSLLFSDGKLLSSGAFGHGEYYFVRKTFDRLSADIDPKADISFTSPMFRKVFSDNAEESVARTFLLDIYTALFSRTEKAKAQGRGEGSGRDCAIVDEIVNLVEQRPACDLMEASVPKEYARLVQEFIGRFIDVLHQTDGLLCGRNDLKSENLNIAIVEAAVVLSFCRDHRYPAYFLDYAATQRWGNVANLSVSEVMTLFEAQLERKRRTIFVSMPFHKYACDYHYQVIEEVVGELNEKCEEQLGDALLDCHRIDRNKTGKTFEINQKVADAISECGLLIADLTYSNVNVFHEVGLLMGRAFALKGRTNEFDMILLRDESESSVNDVEYNLHSLQIVRFKHPGDLRKQLRDRLLNFYKLKLDVEKKD